MREDASGDASGEDFPPIGGESETVTEAIFDGVEDAVFVVGVERTDDEYEFRFRHNNDTHQRQTGFSEAEIRGLSPRELLGEEEGAEVAGKYRRCVTEHETIVYEETRHFPVGTSHWQTRLTPISQAGRVTRIVGISRNVTREKTRERKLQRVHRRFETVLDTMTAAVFLKDTDGQYLLMNRACRDMLGIDGDADISGMTDREIFPPEVAADARADDKRVIKTGETIDIEERVPVADGETVRLTRKSPVYDDSGSIEAICGVSTDITGQNRRQERFQQQSSFLKAVLEATDQGVLVTDLDWNVLHYNDQFVDMWDLASENGITSDGRALLEEATDMLENPEEVAGLIQRLYATPEESKTAEIPLRDGRTLDFYSAPVVSSGTQYGRLWIYQDITSLKEYERTLEKQRDGLDLLNQVVRHDVRNKLQLVLAHGELLQTATDEPDTGSIEQVRDAARDAIEIMTTARGVMEEILQSEADHRPVQLRGILENEIEEVQSNYDTAVVKLGDNVPSVEVVADDMLASVFRNLLTNGIQHNDAEIPKVTASAVRDGGRVLVHVADNGPGIPADRTDEIFEQGEMGLESAGTGLGLYLVETVVDRYGGEVRVENRDTDGTVFTVELPIAETSEGPEQRRGT